MNATETEVVATLRLHTAVSQLAWAREYGFTPAFVSLVLSGQRKPSARMAALLGYRKRTVSVAIYERNMP